MLTRSFVSEFSLLHLLILEKCMYLMVILPFFEISFFIFKNYPPLIQIPYFLCFCKLSVQRQR